MIGCYGNGLMRIFSVKMEVLLIEVAAHCRLISTVDIAQDSGLVCNGYALYVVPLMPFPTGLNFHCTRVQVLYIHVTIYLHSIVNLQ